MMLHGGDTISYENLYDGELLDFSSNINPLGRPKGLNQKLIDGFDTLEAYPDIKYRSLKNKISEYLKCDIENVVTGNGAVEIIDNFIMLSKRVVTTTPAFAEYSLRGKVHNKEVVKLPYKEDFTIDVDLVRSTIKKGDMLVLGNPNNPTGLRIEKDTLVNIYNIIREKEAFLLLDEAFFEFAPKDYDSIEIFKEYNYDNIGIIRAATKFFGVPGIRLGYGCTNKKLVKEIENIQLPWSINSMAMIAGEYIFDNKEYIEKSIEYIDKERKFLLTSLKKFDWVVVYETHTNYILLKLKEYDEDYVFEYFVRNGIVIRKCSSFKVLGNNHIRVAIKSREDNEKLIEVFKKFTKDEIK